MPGKVKVRIIAGRNLPVMDKSSDTSDAFVEVKLGNTTYKTEVFRRSLNPYWNSECFRFEVDDEELQDEPLQIRIMDYDTYSANDAIGKVYIDLNPLLYKDSGHMMWGWFPIYDTMHGIRGEVHCVVKVDLFSDSNRYRQSSCGVRFFYSPGVPHGYFCQAILGFVEELVVNDDPEYQWIDKIRTPRASNEARQTLFSKLSGEVRRKIGLKALDLGGNSVIGYQQYFDLEGESGIVVRGIGTAAILTKIEHTVRHHHSMKHHNHLINSSQTGSTFGSNAHSSTATGGICEDPESLSSSFLSCSITDEKNPSHFGSSDQSFDPIPVLFLFNYDPAKAVPFSLSSNTSASSISSKPTSPAPITTLSPKLSNWLNKLTNMYSGKKTPSYSFHKHCSKIGLSKDAENLTYFKSSSLKVLINKPKLKRVASQPVTNNNYSNHLSTTLINVCPSLLDPHLSTGCLASSLNSKTSPTLCDTKILTNKSVSSFHDSLIARLSAANNVINDDISTFILNPSATMKGNPLISSSSSTDTYFIPTTPNAHPPVNPTSSLGNSGTANTKIQTESPLKTGNFQRKGSSDPDLSITPKGSGGSYSSSSGTAAKSTIKFMISSDNLHLLEYPFITMKQFPVGFIAHIGGSVSSRSVKLLDHINCPEDPETRDSWWMELRKEIRSHCRSLACNAVLGYSEATYICDEVVILSASGTAAILATPNENEESGQTVTTSKDKEKPNGETSLNQSFSTSNKSDTAKVKSSSLDYSSQTANCSICHISYSESSVSFYSSLFKCNICKKQKVSEVLFMTIEPPSNIPIKGIGCLIQARVCRYKRDSKGEQCAKEISDSLPFLEHELHRQLLSKIKVKGMNAIFGLTVQISFGENMLIALATGTAAYISALPSPTPPQISSGKGVKNSKLTEIQKLILESIARNREHYGLNQTTNGDQASTFISEDNGAMIAESEDVDPKDNPETWQGIESDPEVDPLYRNNDGCVVLEVDDTEDADIISLMIDSDIPKGYEICNTELMPGLSNPFACNLQTFTQVYRAKLTAIKQFGQQFDWIIQSLFVKLRRVVPCCLTNLKFRVDLPEQDLVQITVLGSALSASGSLTSSLNTKTTSVSCTQGAKRPQTVLESENYDDLLFTMDDDPKAQMTNEFEDLKIKENIGIYNTCQAEAFGIELTPLSYIPGAYIQNYLGNLDFFFIRESTSIRENGGLNGFMHSFLSEVFAIVRAHVAGLGGNAMISLHLTQCVLLHNPHKNQAQCLINVAGDAVVIQTHPHK